MLFNSLHFTLFFPLAVLVFFATPHRFRWLWLLISSYYFYMCWKPIYVLLIMSSTLVDYWVALAMGRTQEKRRRKQLLAVSLAVNLGLLGAFKYFNFIGDSLEQVLAAFNLFADIPTFQALLPVGISFYTFQTLSYTFEVYRGKLEPERHLGYFAVYVTFWPQLVAGPIERPQSLLPQLRDHHVLTAERLRSGLSLMLWGFFQKLVIADRLAIYANAVYEDPTGQGALFGGGAVWLATYAFSFQIYCDFSGYSLIAIGAARVMGIDLMTNFRRPYLARSIGDFWKRWHISLSSWFKDYVYIPLGGSRTRRWKHFRNLMVTFGISGVWHGAGWTFVVWGALHGAFIIATLLSTRWRDRFADTFGMGTDGPLRVALQRLLTFHLVALSWVFFRATDLEDALELLRRMVSDPFTGFPIEQLASLAGSIDPWIAMGMVLVLMIHESIHGDEGIGAWLAKLSPTASMLWHFTVAVLLMWLGVFTSQEFLYFQF